MYMYDNFIIFLYMFEHAVRVSRASRALVFQLVGRRDGCAVLLIDDVQTSVVEPLDQHRLLPLQNLAQNELNKKTEPVTKCEDQI